MLCLVDWSQIQHCAFFSFFICNVWHYVLLFHNGDKVFTIPDSIIYCIFSIVKLGSLFLWSVESMLFEWLGFLWNSVYTFGFWFSNTSLKLDSTCAVNTIHNSVWEKLHGIVCGFVFSMKCFLTWSFWFCTKKNILTICHLLLFLNYVL